MATSFPITSWLRAFFALQQAAMDACDVMEIPDADEDVIRWARTTTGDVRAIAMVLDPLLRKQPLRFGGRGLARRWRSCIDALAREACDAEYSDNRTFWRALPAMFVYLHSQCVPLPPSDVWTALLDQIGTHVDTHSLRSAR
jgi:hypothetical protein